MNLRSRVVTLASAILYLSLAAPHTHATTYLTVPWQFRVIEADMVGIVECETAGGIVAGYRVVESWKGPPAGTVLRIESGTNYWGPQFPIALVGERYLVFAFKREAPVAIMSTSSGGTVPLWWRQLPADYHVAVNQGRLRLPGEKVKGALWSMGYEHGDLESFKKDVRFLLSLNPDGQEAQLLVAHLGFYRRGPFKRAARRLSNCSSTTTMVTEILKLGRKNSPWGKYAIDILRNQTGEESLRVIRDLPDGAFPSAEKGLRQELIQNIEKRLQTEGTTTNPDDTQTPEAPPPGEAELKALREQLLDSEHSSNQWKAFDRLAVYDPAFVTDFLREWVEPQGEMFLAAFGHVLVSSFARSLDHDRTRHLRALLDAKDPYVRVGAAIYLSFDEPGEGLLRLREFTSLPGNPGAWAALNVVRRKDGSALPRAFEALKIPDDGMMSSMMNINLQSRVEILVSNIAHLSGVPPPAFPEPISFKEWERGSEGTAPWYQKLYGNYLGWWQTYKGRLVIEDPWFEELKAQRVD